MFIWFAVSQNEKGVRMMGATNVWEYLDNIWILAGFVLIVFAGLLKSISGKKFSDPSVEKLMHKGINYLFILGLVSIIMGFVKPENKNTKASEITQTINNSSGTSINAGRHVNHNQPSSPASDHAYQEHSSSVNQQIKDFSGVAINAGGNVSTRIHEK